MFFCAIRLLGKLYCSCCWSPTYRPPHIRQPVDKSKTHLAAYLITRRPRFCSFWSGWLWLVRSSQKASYDMYVVIDIFRTVWLTAIAHLYYIAINSYLQYYNPYGSAHPYRVT